ncbi:MAG: DinB family protein [Trueperaceae bacterium]
MKDDVLRRALLELLEMGSAHITLDQAIGGLEIDDAFLRPAVTDRAANGAGVSEPKLHSVWELLEHMRLAQEDILHYTIDPAWRSPPFPEGLWPPAHPGTASEAERERLWHATLAGFRAELEQVRDVVRDPALDLTDEIPHGEGRTYLRQVFLVADHNAYHLGQVVSIRRLLGLWR